MRANGTKTALIFLAVMLPFLSLLTQAYGPFVYWSVSGFLLVLGAAGLIQTILAGQNALIAHGRNLSTPNRFVAFRHLMASAFLFAGGVPGLILAYALYSRLTVPELLGPILAPGLLGLLYGLLGYAIHSTCLLTRLNSESTKTIGTAWLLDHNILLRRYLLVTVALVTFSLSVVGSALSLDINRSLQSILISGTHDIGAYWATLSVELWDVLMQPWHLPAWLGFAAGSYFLLSRTILQTKLDSAAKRLIAGNFLMVYTCVALVVLVISTFMRRDIGTLLSPLVPVWPLLVGALAWSVNLWLTQNIREPRDSSWWIDIDFSTRPVTTRIFQFFCVLLTGLSLLAEGADVLIQSHVTVGLVSLAAMYTLSRQRKLERAVARRTEDLKLANAKNEALLLNVLPASIAERLKGRHESMIADDHRDVSILFADIVGFTAMSAAMSSSDLVKLLGSVFSRFDTLAEKFGVEKIKTIGDAYMVASGVPLGREDHAESIAGFALAMQKSLETISIEMGRELSLRIGIHSGPVTAGVIGTRKFAYDLWGDTVNTASRMESNGTVGKIQVSQYTQELLQDCFVLEPRGMVAMKGKGELMTYYLRERRG